MSKQNTVSAPNFQRHLNPPPQSAFSLNDAQSIIQLLQTRTRLENLVEGQNVQKLLERFARHVELTVKPEMMPPVPAQEPSMPEPPIGE